MLNQTSERRLGLKLGKCETSMQSRKDGSTTKELSEEHRRGQRALVNLGEKRWKKRRGGERGSRRIDQVLLHILPAARLGPGQSQFPGASLRICKVELPGYPDSPRVMRGINELTRVHG